MHAAFQVHMLTETGKDKAKQIAEAFDDLVARLNVLCRVGTEPNANGREFSICMTKLEEAGFFAKKAMAIHNCEPQ